MTESSSSRRPQQNLSIRHNGDTVLAQENLDTISESSGETFFYNEVGGNLTIVADARLDNRTELFQKFGISTVEQKDFSDEQLILTAYRKWGDECVERLLGNFAFAI